MGGLVPSIITGQIIAKPRSILGLVDAIDRSNSSASVVSSLLSHSSNEMESRNTFSPLIPTDDIPESSEQGASSMTITDPAEIQQIFDFINTLPRE